MHATTSFKVEEDNIAIVQELSHTRECQRYSITSFGNIEREMENSQKPS